MEHTVKTTYGVFRLNQIAVFVQHEELFETFTAAKISLAPQRIDGPFITSKAATANYLSDKNLGEARRSLNWIMAHYFSNEG